MFKNLIKIILVIGYPIFLNSEENKSNDSLNRPITGTVIIDGYVATCYSKCILDNYLKSCEWIDKNFVKHYSHGHCPEDEKMFKEEKLSK